MRNQAGVGASGSEANNLAIQGVALARHGRGSDGGDVHGGHIVTTAIEHPAVLRACRYLEQRFGCRLAVVPVDDTGLADPDDIRRAVEADTVLISVMHANNEAGTVQPIDQIAKLAIAQSLLVALIVDPIAPNLAALRRVSSNAEWA